MTVQAAAHVVAPIVGQRVAGDDADQAAGDRLDGRERVVQLVAEHADQALPGLQFLLAQGLGQVGDHHQFERQAVLADARAAHAPAAGAAGEDGLQRGLRRAVEADFQLQFLGGLARAGARRARPAGARRRDSPGAGADSRRTRRWRRRSRASRCAAAWWLPCAPRRCSRSVLPSVLTSRMTSPSASSGRGERPRTEKSPSRSAPSRLESVCSGNTTRSRTAKREAQPRADDQHGEGPLRCAPGSRRVHSIHSAVDASRAVRRAAPAARRGLRG